MFRRLQVARAGRRPGVHPVHSAQQPTARDPAVRWVHGSEAPSRHMKRIIRRLGRMVARIARDGPVQYLRVRSSERSGVK